MSPRSQTAASAPNVPNGSVFSEVCAALGIKVEDAVAHYEKTKSNPGSGAALMARHVQRPVKTFLFLARTAELARKPAGAFGSYTHSGDAPAMVFDRFRAVGRSSLTLRAPPGTGRFHDEEHTSRRFVPGETPVLYAGRVFDADEIEQTTEMLQFD